MKLEKIESVETTVDGIEMTQEDGLQGSIHYPAACVLRDTLTTMERHASSGKYWLRLKVI